MISKEEFEFMKKLKDLPEALPKYQEFKKENLTLLDKFKKENFIDDTWLGLPGHCPVGFKLTINGKRAFEEYLAFEESQARESETLKIAREANDISKQANSLSENANSIASNSKTLSKWAVGISIAATLISIVDIIIRACT